MFKRKESFSEHGNYPPGWHNFREQPDDKLALISPLPHTSRGDLTPLSLPTPGASTAFLAGLSRGWFTTPLHNQCKGEEDSVARSTGERSKIAPFGGNDPFGPLSCAAYLHPPPGYTALGVKANWH